MSCILLLVALRPLLKRMPLLVADGMAWLAPAVGAAPAAAAVGAAPAAVTADVRALLALLHIWCLILSQCDRCPLQWGAVERRPRRYDWAGYRQLFALVRALGLKLQVGRVACAPALQCTMVCAAASCLRSCGRWG